MALDGARTWLNENPMVAGIVAVAIVIAVGLFFVMRGGGYAFTRL